MTLNEFTTKIAARFDRQLDMQYRQWLVPHINDWRSRLIRNSLEKRPQDRNQFVQYIKIPLTYGDYTCGAIACFGSFSEDVPKLLRIGDTPFEYLGGMDRKSPYRYNDIGTSMYISAGKTAWHFIHYEMDNDKVIIPDRRILEVYGAGIFDDPTQAMQWQCKTANTGCDWFNEPYPVSGDIATDITTAIWNSLNTRGEILPQKQDQDE